jgi:hypothetical protein
MAHNSIEELCDLMPGLELQSDRVAPVHTEPPPPPRPTTLLSELQSDRAAPVHAEPPRRTTLPSRQQTFPFLKLPTEVRFMIYDIALQHIIDDAINPSFGAQRLMHMTPDFPLDLNSSGFEERCKCPPVLGALALLHTNRELRSESADELVRLAFAQVQAITSRASLLFGPKADRDQDRMSRESKQPLFKSQLERSVAVLNEQIETVQGVRVVERVYSLVCLVKHGLYSQDKSEREFDHTMWKIENLVLVAAGLRPQTDWDGGVTSRPSEDRMHSVALSSSRAIRDRERLLFGPEDELKSWKKIVAVERHDTDWSDCSKSVGEHFYWIVTRKVSSTRHTHVCARCTL